MEEASASSTAKMIVCAMEGSIVLSRTYHSADYRAGWATTLRKCYRYKNREKLHLIVNVNWQPRLINCSGKTTCQKLNSSTSGLYVVAAKK
jgi:hypothetical protein